MRAISLAGASLNSSIKRVSLFKEAIGFSDRKTISDEYRLPYGLDIGDIDRDGKNDVVNLSFNFNKPSNNNFIWNRQLPGDDSGF